MNPAAFRQWLLSDPSRVVAFVDDILTPEDVIRDYPYLAGTPKTLENWRYAKKGPRFIKLGRSVVYRRLDILAYLEARVVDPETKNRMRLAV